MKCENICYHSRNIINYSLTIFFGFVMLALLALPAEAQMFTVGNDDDPRRGDPHTNFYVGLEPTTSEYEGPLENDQFNFEGPLIRLGYKMSSLELFLGTGGKVTGIDDVSYLDMGGNINLSVPVHTTKNLILELPVRISSRLTNITNSERLTFDNNRFRFGNLAVGAGAQAMVRAGENLRFQANAIPSYGFAFASGGFLGGSISMAAAEGRMYIDRLFDKVGLSFGYRYNQRRYDIDEDQFDYFLQSHSVMAGISF